MRREGSPELHCRSRRAGICGNVAPAWRTASGAMQMLRGPQSHAPHTPQQPPADDSIAKQAHTYVPLPDRTAKDAPQHHVTDSLQPERGTHRPRQPRGLRAARRTDVPTYEALPRFTTDLNRLTPEQRHRFRQTVTAFVEDCAPEDDSVPASASSASSGHPASTSSRGPWAPDPQGVPPGRTGRNKKHQPRPCSQPAIADSRAPAVSAARRTPSGSSFCPGAGSSKSVVTVRPTRSPVSPPAGACNAR